MSRRAGKRITAALAMYEYLFSVPDGKVITIKKTKGALWLNIQDEVKEPEITFRSFDEMNDLIKRLRGAAEPVKGFPQGDLLEDAANRIEKQAGRIERLEGIIEDAAQESDVFEIREILKGGQI